MIGVMMVVAQIRGGGMWKPGCVLVGLQKKSKEEVHNVSGVGELNFEMIMNRNSRKDGASLSSDDEDEEEEAKGEANLFPFSLLGFLEMSKGFMTRSWNVNLASGTMA
ncbi:hypothetical protein Tco_0676986 [Tanacetum coccineum]